jgi:hypothetical protein
LGAFLIFFRPKPDCHCDDPLTSPKHGEIATATGLGARAGSV